jgi:hypothetical protein
MDFAAEPEPEAAAPAAAPEAPGEAPAGDVGSILAALARVLRETTTHLGATVDRVSDAVTTSPGKVDRDLLVTFQNFDKLHQEFTALGDVISHIAAATRESGAKGQWTNLHETEALAMIVLSDLKDRFERHLLYGSDGLLLPDSNDVKEF